jgi:hypothetical protein
MCCVLNELNELSIDLAMNFLYECNVQTQKENRCGFVLRPMIEWQYASIHC